MYKRQVCNIADAGFLGTLSGKQWQKDYLSGKANVSDTPGMMESMEYIQKWKDLGMLACSNSDPADDGKTREVFIKGNTLFLLGPQNGIMESEDTTDKFGLMPYLSEDCLLYTSSSTEVTSPLICPQIWRKWKRSWMIRTS